MIAIFAINAPFFSKTRADSKPYSAACANLFSFSGRAGTFGVRAGKIKRFQQKKRHHVRFTL
jgi:hypothetical protein